MRYADSPLRSNRWGIASIVVLLGGLIAWAYLSEIAQTARAQGQVIAVARTQVVQSAIDGVIQDLLVSEGQEVKKGQLLVRLDRSQVEAAYFEGQGKVAALKAALARLRAEVLHPPLEFPPDVEAFPEFIANQRQLYQRRLEAMQSDVSALKKSLALVNKELSLNQPLLASGDLGMADIIRLERQAAEISGQIAGRRNKYFQDAQTDMTKAEEDLTTQEQLLADKKETYERAEIHAPANGLVRNIQTTTPGAKLRAGDVILELLPTDGEFVVEAKLKTADVAVMRKDLPAQIKLDAYDYSIYGTLQGKVRYISPDALSEKTPQGEVTYYRVQIDLDRDNLKRYNAANPNRAIEIQPGMTATVEIETGRHTVMSYLIKPVTKTMSEAMNER